MNENNDAEIFYNKRIVELEQKLSVLYKKRSAIAWIRSIIFIAVLVAIYFLLDNDIWIIIAAVVAGLILFLTMVSKDINNTNAINNLQTLLNINKDEINYLHQQFSNKYDGKDLAPANHAYAKDLDVFGASSLFQYINRCNSEQGLKLFAERLLQPLSKQSILQQQKAVKELTSKIVWLQQFQAFGLNEKITFDSQNRIQQWLQQNDKVFIHQKWKILLYIFPVITLTSFYLYLDDIFSLLQFSLLLIVFYFVASSISKKITSTHSLLTKLVPIISTLYKQLNWFEQEKFEDEFLLYLQNSLSSSENNTASSSIQNLKTILNRFDVRFNGIVFFILNTFFLWDLWQIIALNKWKETNKAVVKNWFNVIPQLETAGSFATLSFNNENWCFPKIADDYFTLNTNKINHPLIPKQQSVANSFSFSGTAHVDLITGSNMAGKSTFLRCLGVNMILAYAGSPVCAASFTVSVALLMSSMRIEDNLAENTSTFYAELKKLKSIIDAVNKKEKVFILLDEILRGTNSLDRHTGSIALVKQLIKQNAVAIIATHDIELSKLENEFPQSIKNYHFDVQVNDEKLFFDYKLKQGICRSMNASLLMKQIGIEM